MKYEFEDNVKQWQNEAAGWFYVNMPTEYYDELMDFANMHKRGFRSLRVEAELGASKWNTSIFPDKSSKTFLLFLKKDIRNKEKLDLDSKVNVSLQLRDFL